MFAHVRIVGGLDDDEEAEESSSEEEDEVVECVFHGTWYLRFLRSSPSSSSWTLPCGWVALMSCIYVAMLCCSALCCAALAEGGSIGIVFDEGEEEDTVVIDSIKPGTPAKRRYGGQLEEGMLLSVCRGKDCSGLDFDTIISLITDPKRPLEMTFEFQYEDDSDE